MISIETFSVTPFSQNARVLTNRDTGKSAFLDPGGDVERFMHQEQDIESILLTHSHIDHCGGVAMVLRQLSAWGKSRPLLYAGGESEMRRMITVQAQYFGLEPGTAENCPEPDVLLEPNMMLSVVGVPLEARFTPGHSPGHFSFVTPEIQFELQEFGRRIVGSGRLVFAGDALFQGSIGRTDLPGGDHQQLLNSIREELFTLPGDTIVLSGHGPMTTIERELRQNPFFQ